VINRAGNPAALDPNTTVRRLHATASTLPRMAICAIPAATRAIRKRFESIRVGELLRMEKEAPRADG